MAPSNPIDYFAIQNTLSRYSVALDSKDFQLLRDVFTEDAIGIYPFGTTSDVESLIGLVQGRLVHIVSQHALTTQMIEIADDGRTAQAMTYFTGIHFGKGKWTGQQLTAWGKYTDELVLVADDDGTKGRSSLPGASGRWLIKKREVAFVGRLGEEGVMGGE